MPDTNKERQTAYLELIIKLTQCFQNDEDRILTAHPELVDEGLVMKFLSTAGIMSKSNDLESVFIILWLINFARRLADKLNLQMDINVGIDKEAYRGFFKKLLGVFFSSKGDKETINQFLYKQDFYLDKIFLELFPEFTEELFTIFDSNVVLPDMASLFKVLGTILHEYPRGNREINVELAISC
jgi:hypothetical protein